MKIETRKIHDVLVVDMSGTLDSTSSGEAGDRIVNVAEGEHKRVLLNLAELEYVSSAGLRVILRRSKVVTRKPWRAQDLQRQRACKGCSRD
jgi:anti-sigma B factor antagonist